MKVEFVAPFLTSTITVISQVVGLTARKGNVSVTPPPVMGDEVNVSVGVTGSVTGQVVYSMNLDCAKTLAGIMMGEKLRFFDELAKSAINELANMITGNAAIQLASNGYESVLTPPAMFVGKDLAITTPMPILTIPVNLSNGSAITIYVALEDKPSHT